MNIDDLLRRDAANTLPDAGFTERVPSAEGHGQGWIRVLEWLRAHAET